jgi:hypothetical protein
VGLKKIRYEGVVKCAESLQDMEYQLSFVMTIINQISVHRLSYIKIATLLHSTLQHYMFRPQTATFRCFYVTDIFTKTVLKKLIHCFYSC